MKVSKLVQQKILKITSDCFKEFESKVIKRVFTHQDQLNMVNLGLDDPEGILKLSEQELTKLRAFKVFLEEQKRDEKNFEDVPDWAEAKLYDEELDRRLLKAIENKELPKYTLTILKKKTRKYVRRNKSNNK